MVNFKYMSPILFLKFSIFLILKVLDPYVDRNSNVQFSSVHKLLVDLLYSVLYISQNLAGTEHEA